ncbi:MAG: glycosyltransferase family 4 protein [Chitinophagales bacterium]|nr:glycosyltransferase family 4 protein [Chitinophagales bacterium]
MKILHVIPHLGCGGAEILVGKIALHQKRLRHQVEIVTLHQQDSTFEHYPDHEKLEREIPITITPSRVKLLKRNKNEMLCDWKNILGRFSPNVIHAHLYEADVLAHSALLPNVNYITHVHGPVFPLEKKKKIPSTKKELYEVLEKKWLHKKYRDSNTHFIAISRATSDYTKTIIPHSLYKNIEIILNAIELEKFPYQEQKKISFPIKLITTGNLVAKKNHDFMIRVVKHLIDAGINCELEILGYGVKENELRDLTSFLGIENKIQFRGSVGNVADYLSNAHIYLHAAIPEPFGLAILEAMATGLPPVTIDGGGNRDFIEDGKNGFIIPEKNIMVFAERIISLINDQELYSTISKEARATAIKFDFESYVQKVNEFYKR